MDGLREVWNRHHLQSRDPLHPYIIPDLTRKYTCRPRNHVEPGSALAQLRSCMRLAPGLLNRSIGTEHPRCWHWPVGESRLKNWYELNSPFPVMVTSHTGCIHNELSRLQTSPEATGMLHTAGQKDVLRRLSSSSRRIFPPLRADIVAAQTDSAFQSSLELEFG